MSAETTVRDMIAAAAAKETMENAMRIADEVCGMLTDYPVVDCGAALMMCMSRVITMLAHNNESTRDVEWKCMRRALDQMMTGNMTTSRH